MLRFIVRRRFKDLHCGVETETFQTIDAECPALEAVLSQGGYGEAGYDQHSLIGVEVRSSQGEE
jgi:hypothetical protein